MFTEYTVGLDCSPIKIIKPEPINTYPNILMPITISDSPDPSPLKEQLVEPTYESIYDNGERDDPIRNVNFRGMVRIYEIPVDKISGRTCEQGRLL